MKKILFLVLAVFLISLVSAFQVVEKYPVVFDTFDSGGSTIGGAYINVTNNDGLEVLSFNISAQSEATRCYAYDTSNATLYTGTLADYNCTFASPVRAEYGSEVILFTNDTGSWVRAQKTPVTYPMIGGVFYFARGVYAGGNYTNYGFELDYVIVNVNSTIENNITVLNTGYNLSSFETSFETFRINITAQGTSIPTARLFYNGTDYGEATRVGDNTELEFKKKISVPNFNFDTTNLFYWNLTYRNISDVIFYGSQQSYPILFGLCNSSLKTRFLNLTFKDESTNLYMNASLPLLNFYSWIGNQSLNVSYSLINNTENFEYGFCMRYNNTINTYAGIQYQSTDYPQRLYRDTLTLTNTTTNKTLYLLSSTDGIYVTFQVQNANTEQSISGVNVIGTRNIGGEDVIVAIGTTDESGAVTFWLNPDYLHTLNFSKSGYNTYTTSIFPTQSSYTISLTTGTGGTTSTDYTRGISYKIRPSGDYLINNTNYNFNFTLNTSYWNVEQFGFGIYYDNGSLMDSVSSTANGGIVSVVVDTLNSSTMRMNFYYIINSTSYNGTRMWYVESGGTSYSILHFFEDLTDYMDAGMFGMDDFARVIICIFIIVMMTGGLIMRYGIANEAVIMGMLFGIVFFLDIGIGLIPALTFGGNSIPHFITIALGLLLTGFLIKEEMK